MDYLKTVVPSQLISERGSNLIVINPGSANVRIGLATHDAPLDVPHCIARYTTSVPKLNVQDQVTMGQHMEREKACDVIVSLLKIPFLDEEVPNNSFPCKLGRVDGFNPESGKKDVAFTWTNVYEKDVSPPSTSERSNNERPINASVEKHEISGTVGPSSSEHGFKKIIYGEEALRISPKDPYCLRRPIRRGHLNISQYYPMQQVLDDINAILGLGFDF